MLQAARVAQLEGSGHQQMQRSGCLGLGRQEVHGGVLRDGHFGDCPVLRKPLRLRTDGLLQKAAIALLL